MARMVIGSHRLGTEDDEAAPAASAVVDSIVLDGNDKQSLLETERGMHTLWVW